MPQQQAAAARQALQRRQRKVARRLHRDVPFSWTRCLVSLASYALLLTDVLRTGFALRELPMYKRIDPNTLAFGPFAYTTVHLTRKNATSGSSVSLWPYKYDSTSISMRAIAKHLAVPAWSPCLLYETPRDQCNEGQNLARATVFAMIDNMIDSVRDYEPLARSAAFTGRLGANMNATKRSGHVTLRLAHRWIDRLYDLVLPEIFERIVRRSSQAIYYDHKRLLDDYRFQCTLTTMSVLAWYTIVTMLRAMGHAALYKVKLTPGSVKKGKAAKTALEYLLAMNLREEKDLLSAQRRTHKLGAEHETKQAHTDGERADGTTAENDEQGGVEHVLVQRELLRCVTENELVTCMVGPVKVSAPGLHGSSGGKEKGGKGAKGGGKKKK
ncbi:hypothetical protein P43SY_011915 [Pythium insidiosum]|uniref:NFACT protein C-terminal domain-containing protein n=1 Tax=Pythium insidiosum TaxID=114742 RepID=A0AAD5M129_PYTIN|nr:hypothetical protein P43SY_011915 [Pythium insidiosum]